MKTHTLSAKESVFFMDQPTLFTVQSLTRKRDVITFTWTDVGKAYRVYRDGKRIYEGTVPFFTDDMVIEGKLYDYSIECVQDESIRVIRIQTTPDITSQNNQNPLITYSFTTIVQANSIKLIWAEFEGVEVFEIYRNNVLLAEVKGNEYIDEQISSVQSYTYRIQWRRSLTRSEKNFRNGRMMLSNFLLMMEGKKTFKEAIDRFTFVKKLAPVQRLLRPMKSQEVKSKKLFTLRYTTFIADLTVQHAHLLSKHSYFQGDNRQFHPEGQTYRTRVDVMYNLVDQKQPIHCQKNVGQTISYNRLGKVRKKDFAQLHGIGIDKLKNGKKGFRLMHSVHNPIVVGPHIDYELDVLIEENGSYHACGWHNEAPHHEVYVAFENEEWEPIHLSESKGLIWLADLMGVHYWRFSTFY